MINSRMLQKEHSSNCKWIIVIAGAAIVFLLATVAAIVYFSTLEARIEAEVREDILQITPLGTSMNEVINLVEGRPEWEDVWIDEDLGFYIYVPYYADPPPEAIRHGSMHFIGVKSVSVVLRDRAASPFRGNPMYVYWGFDEQGSLIDVKAAFGPEIEEIILDDDYFDW